MFDLSRHFSEAIISDNETKVQCHVTRSVLLLISCFKDISRRSSFVFFPPGVAPSWLVLGPVSVPGPCPSLWVVHSNEHSWRVPCGPTKDFTFTFNEDIFGFRGVQGQAAKWIDKWPIRCWCVFRKCIFPERSSKELPQMGCGCVLVGFV